MIATRRTLQLLAVVAAMLLPCMAAAQAWPDKAIAFVVPFPPGGGTDAFACPLPPQVIVVNAQRVKETALQDLIADMKKSPGKLIYASAANGSSHYLAGELIKGQTKTFITHIPDRGAGLALQDFIAGKVDLMFDGLGSSSSHIRSGRIRALAVAAPKRSPAFPDIPVASQAEFGAMLSAGIKRWGLVVKAAGVRID